MKQNRRQHLLQDAILRRCHHGSGTPDEKYEDCKSLIKEAESEGIIAGSDYNEWIKLATAALDI